MASSWFRQPSILPGFGLTLGFTTFFLSALVLLPLAALVVKTTALTWSEFVSTVLDERAVASYRLSFGAALVAACVNAVFGFIVAWSLVRYEFPGRRFIDALIDLPFALPTAVSGIALAAVFSPTGWLGVRLQEAFGVQVAYTRSVQPALIEAQRDLEEAAETLGAGPFYVFRRIVLPAVMPALVTGFTMAFARGVGEYGSVVFISGNLPFKTEITPLLIVIKLEQFEYGGAAALGFTMLLVSFLLLLSINLAQGWSRRRQTGAGGPKRGQERRAKPRLTAKAQ
jgi:sulfate transport system permease protein